MLVLALLTPGVLSATEYTLEEIYVTAQRRTQSLQEIPVSATTFTSEDLRRANITSAKDYLSLTPNVSFQEDGESGSRGVSISIRGISDIKSLSNAVVNSVGVYLDEFSVASVSSGTINPQLQDMERVEVLRGPQGTYFGRNALGGALNLTTKKPVGEYEGEVIAGADFFENRGSSKYLTGIFNVPLTDKFWSRGVVHVETSSGFVENVNPNGTDNSGWDYFHGRLSLRWVPTEQTTVDLQVLHTTEDEGHDPSVNSGVLDLDTAATFGGAVAAGLTPVNEGLGFFPDNQSRINHNTREFNRNDMSLVNLRISHNLTPEMRIASVTGFIGTDSTRRSDLDQTSLDIVTRENDFEATSWSQELRFEVTKEYFDLVIGGLYAKDEQERTSHIFMGEDRQIGDLFVLPPTVAFPPGTPRATINRDTNEFDTESLAGFVDLTLRPLDRLELIAGGRYTRDEVRTGATNVFVFGGAPLPDVSGKEVFKDFSPRLSLRYQVSPDANVYGLVSKGYKAGGVNVGHDDDNDPFSDRFDKETLWNYEIGFKSEWFDNRLRLNAAAFYMDWKNLQLETFFLLDPADISSQVELTHNVSKAKSKGFEVELAAAVAQGLVLSGGLGYLDSEIKSGETIVITGGAPVHVQGLPVPKSPKWTGNLAAQYNFETPLGDSYIRANWVYRSSSYADVEAIGARQLGLPEFPYKLPQYDVFGLSAGFTWRERVSVSAYVENLFGEDYYTSTSENFGLGGIRLRPHPRIIGVNLNWKFN